LFQIIHQEVIRMSAVRIVVVALLSLMSSFALAADGLIAIKSPHSVKDTIDRLDAAARARGLNVFLRVDHAVGAKKIGKDLRPTELLVFGNPQGGTPLMECAQSAGIDLPLKALAWQDASGQAWLSYNDPQYLADRHGAKDCGPVVQNLRKALAGLAQEAVR
jgi:uncharacterized protein (DUF302 family)